MSERVFKEDLLDAKEVASFLEVNPVTVYRWCREGRLPCVKIGRYWRIRPRALEDFLRRSERTTTLVDRLRTFVAVPDSLLAVAETPELLHRLDAAFFKVAEARGELMVKFYGTENASERELRESYARENLDVGRLEAKGQLSFRDEEDPSREREQTLNRLAEEYSGEQRTVWASFDWSKEVDLAKALRQQAALTKVVESRQIVIKTAVLEKAIESWNPATLRRAQTEHSGTIWLSETGVSMSRMTLL